VPALLTLMLVAKSLCTWHARSRGQDGFWYAIIWVVPGGSVIYFLLNWLPELVGHRTQQAVVKAARDRIDPERALRRAEAELERADTTANRIAAADALIALDRYQEAMAIYEELPPALYDDDPKVLLRIAACAQAMGQADRAIDLLNQIRTAEPGYQNAEAHLIYALAELDRGNTDDGIRELESLVTYATGEEARGRLMTVYEAHSRPDAALGVADEMLRRARLSPSHYRRMEARWIRMAQATRDRLSTGSNADTQTS